MQYVADPIFKFDVVCPHDFTTLRRLSIKAKVFVVTLLLSVVSVMQLRVVCVCGLVYYILFIYSSSSFQLG